MSRVRPLAVPAGGFREIAILRLGSLGDVVLTLPVVEALHAAYPQARLHYWVKEEYADLVRFHPAIAHVRALDRDARRLEDLVSMSAELEDCDLLVDLHANLRTRILMFRQKAPRLRVAGERLLRERWVRARWSRPRPATPTVERYAATLAPIGVVARATPHVYPGDAATAWASSWWQAWSPPAAPLAMCPGAAHETKRWPQARWRDLDARLEAEGTPRLYLGTAAEHRAWPDLARQVEASALARWVSEPLPRVMALLARCSGALSHDSGLMHLAAASGLSVVALFGSTVPELGFSPAGPGHIVLCRHEPCQPCTLHGLETCPRRHFRCMLGIEPAEVLAALRAVRGAS